MDTGGSATENKLNKEHLKGVNKKPSTKSSFHRTSLRSYYNFSLQRYKTEVSKIQLHLGGSFDGVVMLEGKGESHPQPICYAQRKL